MNRCERNRLYELVLTLSHLQVPMALHHRPQVISCLRLRYLLRHYYVNNQHMVQRNLQ